MFPPTKLVGCRKEHPRDGVGYGWKHVYSQAQEEGLPLAEALLPLSFHDPTLSTVLLNLGAKNKNYVPFADYPNHSAQASFG